MTILSILTATPNGVYYPEQDQVLTERIKSMPGQVDDRPDGMFLTRIFKADVQAFESNLDFHSGWVLELSEEAPNFLFILDACEEKAVDEDGDPIILSRWYIRDGRVNKADLKGYHRQVLK